jgi:ATP-dependent Clp protease adapter protein ClpS
MSLYLINDDENTFDNVIYILTQYVPMCNSLRAEQIAQLVHKSGECHIHSGFSPEIYMIYAQIQKAGLNVKLKLDKKS